jgi:hypothetical protein
MTDAANDWEEAFQAILDRRDSDIDGFLLRWFSSTTRLDFVVDHMAELRRCGLFEQGLLWAWIDAKTNIRNWTRGFTRGIFALCDRDRLLAAGQSLPGSGPFELYRGVAGKGAARRKRGVSWTSSIARARWFAAWYVDRYKLPDPSVYRTVVDKRDVIAYSNERQEEEFLLLLKPNHEIDIFERLSETAIAEYLDAESRRARQELKEFRARHSNSGKEA